ncbi:MAG: hypothetical protein HDQ88_02350 [Clostridia bacterium]|nr:hypothetical protein [Clostridia bacterium]
MANTLIVNLFGAPGAGKSTGAAYVFAMLKAKGINAELISEFAKGKVWEGNQTALDNQAYLFGKQYYTMTRCQDKVDVIITDAPLLNSVYYNQDPLLGEEFNAMVRKIHESYNNLNVYVNRVKAYNPKGRYQSEERSNEMADEIHEWLTLKENQELMEINGCTADYDRLVEVIMAEL